VLGRLLPVLAAALLAGCAYARDRAADLADIVAIEAGAGIGLHADVKATDWAHLGLGYAHVRKVGLRGRDIESLRDREVGLPLSGTLAVGAWRDGNLARLGHLHADIPDLLAYEDPWRRADVEVGVTAGVLSLRAGFSPGQLVDFLAGLVGLDPAGDDRGLAFDDPAEPGARWLPGDLHEHGEPPDYPGHAPIAPEDSLALARAAGCEFAGLNPHFWTYETTARDGIRAFAARAAALSADPAPPVVMPGFEMTSGIGSDGHALLLFRRPEDAFAPLARTVSADGYVREALARLGPRDRLLIPTHPRTRDLRIPYVPDWAEPWPRAAALARPGAPGVTDEVTQEGTLVVRVEGGPTDEASLARRFGEERQRAGARPLKLEVTRDGERVLGARAGDAPDEVRFIGSVEIVTKETGERLRDLSRLPFDGLEALTLLHHLGELAVGRSGADLALDDVFRVLDRRIAAERRRYIATGGSDNHRDLILPTLWVLAREPSREAIFDALVEGRIAVGGDEACSLEARTDLEPRWRAIGADLRAARRVELRWRGTGTLVVDGEPLGARRGGFEHEIAPGSFHFYRLEAGPGRRSRSCWIYVNRVAGPAGPLSPEGRGPGGGESASFRTRPAPLLRLPRPPRRPPRASGSGRASSRKDRGGKTRSSRGPCRTRRSRGARRPARARPSIPAGSPRRARRSA
jgi:hypothetical protein